MGGAAPLTEGDVHDLSDAGAQLPSRPLTQAWASANGKGDDKCHLVTDGGPKDHWSPDRTTGEPASSDWPGITTEFSGIDQESEAGAFTEKGGGGATALTSPQSSGRGAGW